MTFRGDPAGRDQVHSNAVWPQFASPGASLTELRGFGSHIGRKAWIAQLYDFAANLDDSPETTLTHTRQDGLQQQQGRFDEKLQLLQVRIPGLILNGQHGLISGGIYDQHLYGPEREFNLADEALHSIFVAHISTKCLGDETSPLQLAAKLLGPRPTREVVHGNAVTCLSEARRHRGSQPARSSCDENGSSHTLSIAEGTRRDDEAGPRCGSSQLSPIVGPPMTPDARLSRRILLATSLLVPAFLHAQQPASAVGFFRGSADIGTAQKGATSFDAATGSYRVSGGGDDVWGAADAFRFTWTQLPGDGSLTADVQVAQPNTHPKAKGMLMIRQSLDPGSPYADIAIHGDGHITLQYRLTQGGQTKDTDLPQHGATRLRIERKGDVYTASVVDASGATAPPPFITLTLKGQAYAGLGVCSHSTTSLQTVVFRNVKVSSAITAAITSPDQ